MKRKLKHREGESLAKDHTETELKLLIITDHQEGQTIAKTCDAGHLGARTVLNMRGQKGTFRGKFWKNECRFMCSEHLPQPDIESMQKSVLNYAKV